MRNLKLIRNDKTEIYFTSDLHYGHRNLVLGETKWIKPGDMPENWKSAKDKEAFCRLNGVRNFERTYEMNIVLINNINEVVGKDDHLFFLGDMVFGKDDNLQQLMSQIICKNRYLVFGNHDKELILNKNGERGYFRRCDHTMMVYVDGQALYLNHYAHRVWNKSHRGAWHLYGHSHGRLKDGWGKSMDVGVDTNDFAPYSFQDIKRIMDKREIKVVDHHGSIRDEE